MPPPAKRHWSDASVGSSRERAALWLFERVGEGHVFTKAELRAAFPEIEQIDRRVRDLRSAGWVIHTNRQDARLRPNELRLVSVGDRIWEASSKRHVSPRISAADRRAAMRRCDYRCVRCGVGAGEAFGDSPSTSAVLTVRTSSAVSPGSPVETMVLCQRCFGSPADADLAGEALRLVGELNQAERATVLRWIDAGCREIPRTEGAWQRIVRLSPTGQRDVRAALEGAVDAGTPGDGAP